MKKLILTLIFVGALSGCRWWRTDAEVNVAVLEAKLTAEREAKNKEDAARAAADKTRAERGGAAAAWTTAANEAADHVPDGLPKTAVKSDLDVAMRNMPDKPDPSALAEARKANELILSGKLTEAREILADALDRATAAEKKAAAADALVNEANARMTRVQAETDAAIIKTKAEAAAATKAKDDECDRRIREQDAAHARGNRDKDAEIERWKNAGAVMVQKAIADGLLVIAGIAAAACAIAVVVSAVMRGSPVAMRVAAACFGIAATAGTLSLGVMNPMVRIGAAIIAAVTVISVGFSIRSLRKKSQEQAGMQDAANSSAHAFDELVPALAEAVKLMPQTEQSHLIDQVAKLTGNRTKAWLTSRLQALGYGTPESWVASPTAAKAVPNA